MNSTSLFTIEESLDPKILREHLHIAQDHLIELCAIPEWTKIQENRNTFRIDKDFSVGTSQFQCSSRLLQDRRIIKNNLELFDDDLQNRSNILKTYKSHKQKITRSFSVFNINELEKNSVGSHSLKRTLSFSTLYYSPNDSAISSAIQKLQNKNTISEKNLLSHTNKDLYLSKPKYNVPVLDESKEAASVLEKSENLGFSKNINSEAMEAVSDVPKNVITLVEETAKSNFGTPTENNASSAAQIEVCPSNLINQPIIYLRDKSVDNENPIAVSITTESSAPILHANNMLHLNDVNKLVDVKNGTENLDSSSSNGNVKISCSEDVEMHLTEVSKSISSGSYSAKEVVSRSPYDSALNNKNVGINCLKDEELHPPVNSDCKSSNSHSAEEVVHAPCDSASNCKSGEKDCLKDEKKHLVNFESKSSHSHSAAAASHSPPCNSASMNENGKINLKEQKNVEMHVPVTCGSFDSHNTKEHSHSLCDLPNAHDSGKLSSLRESTVPTEGPSKEQPLSQKDLVYNNNHVDVGSLSDKKVNDIKNIQEINLKDSDIKANCSSKVETAGSGKRKLESKQKRSKKHRGEEKHSNLKIRSIKKVGEVRYNEDDVKSMLNILKKFL